MPGAGYATGIRATGTALQRRANSPQSHAVFLFALDFRVKARQTAPQRLNIYNRNQFDDAVEAKYRELLARLNPCQSPNILGDDHLEP
jgi:hypothetical protein